MIRMISIRPVEQPEFRVRDKVARAEGPYQGIPEVLLPGTILIERGTHLPQSFRLENESYPSAWMSVKSSLNSHELENELATTGWTFFYMAGGVRATAFGFDRQKTAHTALKRLIASVRLQKCNCLKIDEVAMHAFLGMRLRPLASHSKRPGLLCGAGGHLPTASA